jgi:hypothetical protein
MNTPSSYSQLQRLEVRWSYCPTVDGCRHDIAQLKNIVAQIPSALIRVWAAT